MEMDLKESHPCAFRQDELMEEVDCITSNKETEGNHTRKEEQEGGDEERLMGEMVAPQVLACSQNTTYHRLSDDDLQALDTQPTNFLSHLHALADRGIWGSFATASY